MTTYNPFTRLPYSSSSISTSGTTLELTGNTTGVTSHSDSANATLYVLGDCALNGVCWANRLRSSLPAIITSDEETKDKFRTIAGTNVFYPMDHIQGYTYDIKTPDGPISSMGFKAQEVEHMFPFLVSNVNGQKGMEYTPLIAWNWEATKKLHRVQTRHSEQLDYLEKENTHLRRMVRMLPMLKSQIYNLQQQVTKLAKANTSNTSNTCVSHRPHIEPTKHYKYSAANKSQRRRRRSQIQVERVRHFLRHIRTRA